MISDVHAKREELMEFMNNPRAWILMANPVWGRMETINNIALFDTIEQAMNYEKACRLPAPVSTPDGIMRSYRPDSLLYDYNTIFSFDPMRPWMVYLNVVENPTIPLGDLPPVEQWGQLTHPRYGVHYDAGIGGPRTNMDHAVPAPPQKPVGWGS